MRGRKNVVLTMVPGQYTVELRHPLRKQTFSVDVPTADMVRHFVELRPVRSRAITYSLFIPGVGNAYRKERRGYVYLGLFAASAVYANSVYTGYNNDLVAYSDAQDAYRRAGSAEAAANLRSELLTQHKQVTDSRGALIIAAGVVAGVYAVQFLDVAISRPRYGYREKPTSRALAYDAGGNTRLAGKDRSMGLSAYMDGTKFTLRASF